LAPSNQGHDYVRKRGACEGGKPAGWWGRENARPKKTVLRTPNEREGETPQNPGVISGPGQ